MRRAAVLMIVSMIAVAAPATAQTHADSAALKKCKKGLNSKKCRCPKGQKLVKKGKKYKCRKRTAPTQQNTGGDTTTNPGTTTDPGTTPGTGTQDQPPPQGTNGAQVERDDQGYL